MKPPRPLPPSAWKSLPPQPPLPPATSTLTRVLLIGCGVIAIGLAGVAILIVWNWTSISSAIKTINEDLAELSVVREKLATEYGESPAVTIRYMNGKQALVIRFQNPKTSTDEPTARAIATKAKGLVSRPERLDSIEVHFANGTNAGPISFQASRVYSCSPADLSASPSSAPKTDPQE